MDRKSIAILIGSFVLLVLWTPLVNRLFPPRKVPITNIVDRAEILTNPAPAATTPITNRLLPGVRNATNTASEPVKSAAEETLELENENVRYVFSSDGGGVKLVVLKDYTQFVGCNRKKLGTNQPVTLNTKAAYPAFAILGNDAVTGNGVFKLTKADGVVRAEQALPNGLRLVKEFRASSNFFLKATVRFENLSGQPVKLPPQEIVVGTSTPMTLRNETMNLGFQWYNGSRSERIGETWFQNRAIGCLPGNPRTEYSSSGSNVVWTAVYNQFFTMILIPEIPATEVIGHRISLPGPSREELSADSKALSSPFGYQAGIGYPAVTIAPNQALERRYSLFAGPKEYKTLSRLGQDVDLVMDFSGFIGFFAKGLLLSMNGLHAIGIAYGLAIVVITVIIKLVFWPLTMASTRSMKRMSALQPQMKALQEKYKDDPKKMNAKLMEFMKENKVSPVGGCLPMVLQIPVFFGFYRMLQNAIELRGARFLWACDLSQADTIFFIPGLDFPVNPLPLVMGVTMLWQASLTPPAPGMDPVQQKIMRYMPLMMMVFLYNFSAGLTLYWTAQNLLTIAQMKLTREKPAGTAGAKAIPAGPAPRKKS